MQLAKDPLEEWALHCQAAGAKICLDSSGAPAPFSEKVWSELSFEETINEAEAEARLREVLCRAYRVDDDMLALAAGAQHADFLFFLSNLRSGDPVAVENPTFMPIRRQAEMFGSVRTLDRPAESGFRPDMDGLRGLLASGAKTVALTNLHNPTAAAMGDDILGSVVDEAGKHGALVLCDEVYREMSYGTVPKGAYQLGENGVSVSSVTKLNGLRPLRLGWLIGPREVAQRVEMARICSSYRLPVHSCLLAAEAVKRREWFRQRVLEKARENLPVLKAWLEGEKRISYRRPDGALMTSLRLPEGKDDLELSEQLLKKSVAVGPGRYWGAPGTIRVTFSCSRDELAQGLGTITSALNSLQDRLSDNY
jgi:aspartate/methionine/tyrosine aminotransferase